MRLQLQPNDIAWGEYEPLYEYLCVQEKYRRHYFASNGTKTLN